MNVPGIHKFAQQWVVEQGVPPEDKVMVATAGLALAVIVVGLIANYIARRFVIRAVKAVIRRTETSWDDLILERHVFDKLSHLAPGMILYVFADVVFPHRGGVADLVHRGAIVYMAVMTALVLDAFISALNDIYETLEVAKQRPIKSYMQVIKIILYVLTGIFVIASVMNRSPVVLLSGLGALSAVLLLVFKDSILGLVASIQLSANDMVRRGDWIEVSQYGADGDVIDIALTTIRVQNFDKTITTVPSYALISDSFRNWRGMKEAGGRRIKRAISLDMDTVRFLRTEDLERFSRFELIRDYLESKRKDVDDDNARRKVDLREAVNGRRLTNIGTFRAYALAYLKSRPDVHQQGMTLMVRQLDPTDRGVGIEMYCFLKTTEWPKYEAIQSDIFDHLLAVVPEFDLRVFQQPTGRDFRAGAGAAGARASA